MKEINRKNWQLSKKYLDYRLSVDQITKGSANKEQTHLVYLLNWAGDRSFIHAPNLRPTFPEFVLTNRLDGKQGKLSPVYVKKTLATARLFFHWLVDYETGYKSIKNSWIRTIKAKRLSEIPKNIEAVSLEEILAIAAQDVRTVFDRRTRAALVFLYLSGIRIGAFVSLPMQAVNIPEGKIIQYPNLGVRTKNSKYAITPLLPIPELLKVVQEWDDEIRPILSPNGLWFAPLSPETGKIDPSIVSIGEHRSTLARRNMKDWLESRGLPYHSPHKFRHGFSHYGNERIKTFADRKALSQALMHSSTKITDETYSNLSDEEVRYRISSLGK